VLNLGDPVYSAWWPDNDWQQPATWWPGTITAFDVRYDVDHGYGPLRLYGIRFDDGDVLNNVEDVYVFPKEEYELTTSSDEQHCMVRNIVDANAQDQWARIVGWYEFSGEQGSVRSFPLLRDALDAYHQPIASNRGSPKNGACNDHINAYVCGRWSYYAEGEFSCRTVSSAQSTNRSLFINETDPMGSKATHVDELHLLSTNRVDLSFYGTAAFWTSSNSKVFDSSIPSPSTILRKLMDTEELDEIVPLKRSTPSNTKSREPSTFGTDLCIKVNDRQQTSVQGWSQLRVQIQNEKENAPVNRVK
jgi:hypothetical protein